ncbi:hypothetical protein [Paraurantiacibacter namhicola]|uniref:hypothetical protein n=1 Tax=Paraurantiacibacter namhicola TaxID=645517 RepID=UPI0012EE0F39|nr:hypothetical protein [Paraurantiacibacter namhicola]
MSAFQQGNADGLCGLYSILNFLKSLSDWRSETPEGAMKIVLEAAQSEGALTPEKITGGFCSDELQRIANRVFARFRMPYRAYHFEEIEWREEDDAYQNHHQVLDSGGAIIGGRDGREHWVLFRRTVDGPVLVNSADQKQPTRAFNGRLKSHCSSDSIALLPITRATVEIGQV